MVRLTEFRSEKLFALTSEEVCALLEMCTLTLAEESPVHLRILSRLGSLYRELNASPLRKEATPLDDLPSLLPSSSTGERLTVSCLY